MFESDAFAKRERALEDEFFHRVDEKLKEELRRSAERDRSREALAAATGLNDPDLIEELLDAGMSVTTLTALALVPAVFVAWADHHVTKAEQETIMKAAKERGIDEDALALQLLKSWLEQSPKKSLWDTWKHFAAAVQESLNETTSDLLSKNVFEISESVAKASGGVLGFGKISDNERKVLDEIKSTLKG